MAENQPEHSSSGLQTGGICATKQLVVGALGSRLQFGLASARVNSNSSVVNINFTQNILIVMEIDQYFLEVVPCILSDKIVFITI